MKKFNCPSGKNAVDFARDMFGFGLLGFPGSDSTAPYSPDRYELVGYISVHPGQEIPVIAPRALPSVILEKDLDRPYLMEDGSFNCGVLPGSPDPSRVVVFFDDGDGEYSCLADECGQRGNVSHRLDSLVRVEIL